MKWLWRIKGWLLVILGIVISVGLYVRSQSSGETKKGLAMGTISRADLIQRVTFSGGIVAARTTIIQAPYDGYIQKIFVNVGDNVASGQPIISMSQTATNEHSAEIFPLRAPFAGTVTQINKTVGQFVSKNFSENNDSTLLRIDDMTRLMVKSDVPEIDYPKLKVGQSVIVKATSVPSKTYRGVIRTVAKASRQAVRWERNKVEFEVTVVIEDADQNLAPGMSALIDVITNEVKDAVVVRHEFLQQKGDTYFVTLENGNKVDIEVGIQNDEFFQVIKGVSEGQKVMPIDFANL
ncbi:MAG: efflux RND transporter periplasmic adaptor subunit [Proteobacteria bacterium]|nr:efflux RND transporter periplasmic adaptor subunit [Pseudomonadota bacterium]